MSACLITALAGLAGCGGGGSGEAATVAKPAAVSALAAPLATSASVPSVLETLRGVVPVDPSGTEDGRRVTLVDYVRDRDAAILLGKALFWDTNVGSDGQTACASCHFHAGADNRIKNQINPGQRNEDAHLQDQFTKPARSQGWGVNYSLTLADFPFHVLQDPTNRNSAILSTTDDVSGSQGVFDKLFAEPGKNRFDDCSLQRDGVFHIGSLDARRATARNTPTVINAVFNVRNFWDGRANNIFNGFSPFGNRDPDAAIWVAAAAGGAVTPARIALADASAASQAVGPPTSDVEMSCGGRTFPHIAKRMLDAKVLQGQTIDKSDSVLGGLKNESYRQLIQAAFQPRLWNGAQAVSLAGESFSQMEANFPLFFGLAIQMYEATLVSDQAPLDKYLQNDPSHGLGDAEKRGMDVFTGQGKCINCHNGPELTAAATRLRLMPQERVERMLMGDEQVALYDNAFYNIGVRPTSEDIGVGGSDPFGNPLSFTRQYTGAGNRVDPFEVNPCKFAVLAAPTTPCDPATSTFNPRGARDAVDGSFKVPSLRNIALTGPYFHNGSRATLEQVVEFYNRGGDRRGEDARNTSGFKANPSNLDPDITPLGLTAQQQSDLVAFLKNALTDPRVAWQRAPFDHPSIRITNGHLGDQNSSPGSPVQLREAQDEMLTIKAVGRAGRAAKDGPILPYVANLK